MKIQELEVWEKNVGPYTHIVWHHSLTKDGATVNDYKAIKHYHIYHNGWRDIGYNILIEREGAEGKVVAKWGRPLGMSGAHCKENHRNYNSIGICIVGNYDKGSGEKLSEEHFKVANDVVESLNRYLNANLIHERHSDNAPYKTCPGSAFPFNKLVEGFQVRYTDIDKSAWYYDAVRFCIDNIAVATVSS